MALLSNNTTLRTSFNESPYWDDFSESNAYYRLLYNPERGLQARELTTTQAIFQNQIARFANHIFKDGSRVAGGEFHFDKRIDYVKLRDTNAFGNTVTATNFIGSQITGDSSMITAFVVSANNGAEAAAPNLNTLYIKYTSANTNGSATFTLGESLTANTGYTARVAAANTSLGSSYMFTIGEGIIYAKGHFVWHSEQSLILSKYDTVPSCRVGFIVDEDVIDYTEDATLLDPAQEASAYQSPGADRLRLVATLTDIGLTETAPDDFVELVVIKEGVIQASQERSQYSDIKDELARRTYDESGDYVVRGMTVRVREHLNDTENGGWRVLADGGNTSLLAIGIEPGIAYVRGYDYETLVTNWLSTRKGLDYKELEGVSVAANFGAYILVDELVGFQDVHSGALVTLYDAAEDRITLKEGSTTSPAGAAIGTARVRAIDYESGVVGSASAQYRLYLHDIVMTGGDFRSVRSVYVNHTTPSDGCADVVLDGGECVLKESSFRSLIYPIAARAVRRIRDASNQVDMYWQFQRAYDVTIAADGTFSISTAADETFPFSAGALNDTQKNENFFVTLNSAVDSANLTGTVTAISGQNTVAGVGTAFTTQLYTGQLIKIGSATRRITSIASANTLQVDTNWTANTSGGVAVKTYLAGEMLDFTRRGGSGTTRTITISSDTLAALDLKETLSSSVTAKVITNLKKVDGQEKKKTLRTGRYVKLNLGTHAANTTGPWCLGVPDVLRVTSVRKKSGAFSSASEGEDITTQVRFDSGQRDDIYDLAMLHNHSGSLSNTTHLLVTLDHFEHDTSQGDGYLSINSYPIDDVNAANTSAIMTKEMPTFQSPISGLTYALRDCIDTRPIRTATATSTASVGSATTNPALGTALTVGLSGLMPSVPNEDYTFSMSYYLGRKDIVCVDRTGVFRIVEGIPALKPITPPTPNDAMMLGTIEIAPYPSIASTASGGTRSMQTTVTQKSNRRYTMRDIGVIDQRVTTLEYYQALSLLEKDTAAMKILDDSGLDRFKNGFLVDPFTGSGVSDVFSPDYRAAVDPKARELRPSFFLNAVDLEYANSTNIYRAAKDAVLVMASNTDGFANGELVYQGNILSPTAQGVLRFHVDDRLYVEQVSGTFATSTAVVGEDSAASIVANTVTLPRDGSLAVLPYTHNQIISQRYATTTRNCAGLMWNWVGQMHLVPDGDFWTDISTRPEVRVNFESNLDAWMVPQTSWEAEWGDWTTRWTGEETAINETTTTSTSSGVVTSLIPPEWGWSGGGVDPTTGLAFGSGFTATTTTTTTVEETLRTGEQTRTGTQRSIVPELIEQRLGNMVVDVTLLPWMRSRVVLVRVRGLKPSTRVYPFFDGEAVIGYCRGVDTAAWDLLEDWTAGASSTDPILDVTGVPVAIDGFDADWMSAAGDPLYSDADGDLLFFFTIPNSSTLRFPVGQKVLRVSDSPTNSSAYGQVTTSAEALYTAHGMHQVERDTIISTRVPMVREETVSETRAVSEVASSQVLNRRTTVTYTEDPTQINPFMNMLAGIGGDGGGGGEPVAQSFALRTDDEYSTGVFVTKVDLFFQSKHATLPITVEIREMDTATVITPRVVPFSQVTLEPADVHISDDGSKATPFVFPSPVFLQRGVEYAIVVRPMAANPDYRIWVADLGQPDIRTGERVTVTPFVGVLFASSNDLTYQPIQNEDFKFNLYIADFDTTATGTLYAHNARKEFLSLANTSAHFSTMGEQVRGEPTITLTTLTGTANVGEIIRGASSNATGLIVAGNTAGKSFRLNSISTEVFVADEDVTFEFANNTPTGAYANTIVTAAYPVGFAEFYNIKYANTVLHLAGVNDVPFTVGMEIRGASSNTTAVADTSFGLQMNLLNPQVRQIIFARTNIDWSVKTTIASTLALDTEWVDIMENSDNEFDTERIVLGRAAELDELSGARSLQLKALLTTTSAYLSPVVDLDYISSIIVGNRINNDATGEDGTSGGNALVRHLTRVMALKAGQDAEDVKVIFAAYNPPTTTIKVYAKYLHAEDSDLMTDREWVELERADTLVHSNMENKNDFREAEYDLPASVLTGTNDAVQYTNTESVVFTSYRYIAVKIVLLSPNTSLIPRVRDLRVIALQR